MKTLIALAASVIGLSAFCEYGRISLTGSDTLPCDAAKVEALTVRSTDADAAVTVKAVRRLQSFTNAVSVTTSTTTNIVVTPNREGVYSSEPFVYTNATGSTFVRKGGSDSLSWTHVTNDLYRFVYTDGAFAATNSVRGTNTVFIGGKSFDYTYVQRPSTITTNIVTTATTNSWPVLKATVFVTNDVASATCANGAATVLATNVYLSAGDTLVTTGLSVDVESVEANLIIVK